MRDIAHFKSGM